MDLNEKVNKSNLIIGNLFSERDSKYLLYFVKTLIIQICEVLNTLSSIYVGVSLHKTILKKLFYLTSRNRYKQKYNRTK